MRLDSVRALKVELASFLVGSDAALNPGTFGFDVGKAYRHSRPIAAPHRARSIALGISSGSKDSYRLAVRIQRVASSEIEQIVRGITNRAKGEVDIRKLERYLSSVLLAT